MEQQRSNPTTTKSETSVEADNSSQNDAPDHEAQAREVEGSGLNPLQVVTSVFAAGLGVQSSQNRERDFKQGRAGVFIAAGIAFTVLFVGAVYGVVSLVLSGR